MIECQPRGIFSWTFDLLADCGRRAAMQINVFAEEGSLTVDGRSYLVKKHGLFSGKWTLEREGEVLLTAHKKNPFTRNFTVVGEAAATLTAISPFSRAMVLRSAGRECQIAPHHPLTRRATVSGPYQNFTLACFATWLTILTWRRRSHANS